MVLTWCVTTSAIKKCSRSFSVAFFRLVNGKVTSVALKLGTEYGAWHNIYSNLHLCSQSKQGHCTWLARSVERSVAAFSMEQRETHTMGQEQSALLERGIFHEQ